MTTALAASSTIITSTEDLPGAAPFIEGEVKAYPLAEKPGITLIAIAFDAGTTLPNHTAPAPITLHALSGQVQVTVDGREHPLPAGGIMHIDSRVPHELTAPVRSRVLLTLVGEATEKPVVPAILRKAADGPAHPGEPVEAAPAEDLIPVTDVSGGHDGGCGCGEADDHAPELDVRTIPHQIRHATVFGALQGLRPQASLVLVAHHNPLPLLKQIEQMFSGAIEVTYLEPGPEVWRLRMVRTH